MLRFLLSSALLLASASAFSPARVAGSRPASALGVAIDTSDIKNGMTIELDGEPYKVLSFSIMKQARGAAKTTIKFKNLMKGNTLENTYRSGEKFQTAMIEKEKFVYTYEDGVSQRFRLPTRSSRLLFLRRPAPSSSGRRNGSSSFRSNRCRTRFSS